MLGIEFIGEIYKEGILSETILIYIFELLLGIDPSYGGIVNDNLVAAALKLIY